MLFVNSPENQLRLMIVCRSWVGFVVRTYPLEHHNVSLIESIYTQNWQPRNRRLKEYTRAGVAPW